MSNNDKERKIIFEAELLDNKTIKVSLKSNFIPMLTFAAKLLDLEIENLIIKQQVESAPIIQRPGLKVEGFKF